MSGTALLELGGVVVRLAMLARIAGRVGMPAVPLYLLGGLAFGKGGLIPLVQSEGFIRTGAEIGLILSPQGPVRRAVLLLHRPQHRSQPVGRGRRARRLPGSRYGRHQDRHGMAGCPARRLALRSRWRAGALLVPRAEFSLIVAGLGSAERLEPRLIPVGVGYVMMLAVLGPIGVRVVDHLLRRSPARQD